MRDAGHDTTEKLAAYIQHSPSPLNTVHSYNIIIMRKLLYILVALIALVSCSHEKPKCVDPWATTGVDSTSFRETHYYWKNYNFATTDSIMLESQIPGEVGSIYTKDSAVIDAYDEIVVANVAYVPEDSIDSVWVMVARDQVTIGWVHESELLDKAVPDNAISRFISWFSDSRFLVLFACLCFGFMFFVLQRFRKERFLIVHLNDIRSFYPTLLCLTMSASATIYGTIQCFWPEVWKEFYYYPTLNPFGQPRIIAIFLASVWLILIVGVAVVDDVRKQPNVVNAVSYLISLSGVCMVLYLVFSISVQYHIGYIFLAGYWYFALRSHWQNNHASYRCGNCGTAMREKGKCPNCGAIND